MSKFANNNNNKLSDADNDSMKSLIDHPQNNKDQEIGIAFDGYEIDELYVLATTFFRGGYVKLMMWKQVFSIINLIFGSNYFLPNCIKCRILNHKVLSIVFTFFL